MIELPFAVYSDLKHSFHQIQREINELKEMLAIRSRERLSREKKYQLAAARLERVLIRYAKAGFRPDQPYNGQAKLAKNSK